jgi:hypothetical protein
MTPPRLVIVGRGMGGKAHRNLVPTMQTLRGGSATSSLDADACEPSLRKETLHASERC